ncbi:nucleotidyltransferase domain-containing protein [Streptomyces sp. NPDC052301]|uniref:nucleotidyltransferase domain-containing protein n=1 Tax=Streptomyces sp. NPDC052301 TaxID=3365687 RepID=UPI0037D043DD
MPTSSLLDRFLDALSPLRPRALWAHGSLAGGDYQEGRSDLDLIAVLPEPVGLRTVRQVVRLHRRLRAEPLAVKLHCSYLTPAVLADPDRPHLTWAHGRVMRRPVTPVTRRELHDFGRVLHGEPPGGLLPPVSDDRLHAFVVRDQRDFWRPAVDKARLWRQDAWVDLGLLTFARATVTLRDGRLVSKREALAELSSLGAPAEVLADVTRRRYDTDSDSGRAPATGHWLARRADLTRGYLGPAIDALVTTYG